jgi:hypothetical protein
MTELQEAIVDRLMVVKKIGVQWATGPLGVAVKAVEGRGMFSRGDITDTLGYPMLLCKALHSANTTLESVDDRRTLAITFFSEVAPRPKRPRLTPVQHVRVALWCAESIHSLVCRADCPCTGRVGKLVQGYLTTGRVEQGQSVPSCPAVGASHYWLVPYSESPAYFALLALNAAESAAGSAATKTWSGKHSSTAATYAARVAATVKGLAGAIDFCLALARQVGLKP